MDPKLRIVNFFLVTALWIVVALAVTRGTAPVAHSGECAFFGAPDFIRETVEDASRLISTNLY